MKHVLFTLYECNTGFLDDEEYIKQVLTEASYHMGATLLSVHSHKFHPQGVTSIVLLAESHISIHTWPENNIAVCDVFTCGNANPKRGAIYIGRKLESKDFTAKTIIRMEENLN